MFYCCRTRSPCCPPSSSSRDFIPTRASWERMDTLQWRVCWVWVQQIRVFLSGFLPSAYNENLTDVLLLVTRSGLSFWTAVARQRPATFWASPPPVTVKATRRSRCRLLIKKSPFRYQDNVCCLACLPWVKTGFFFSFSTCLPILDKSDFSLVDLPCVFFSPSLS